MVVLEVDKAGHGELSLSFGFFLRILGSGVLVGEGGVVVACCGIIGSCRFLVGVRGGKDSKHGSAGGVRGVGDCDDSRGAGGGCVIESELDVGVDGYSGI